MNKELIRQEFSQRLVEALDDKDIEPHRRAATLAKWTNKNPKNPEFARKWLTGRSIPQRDNLIIVAQQLNVRAEWLEYGVGPKTQQDRQAEVRELLEASTATDELKELISDLSELNDQQLSTIRAMVKTWAPHSPK